MIHSRWREEALGRFPRADWPLDLPDAIWPGVADVLETEPTVRFEVLIRALQGLAPDLLQERLLFGLLHNKSAVRTLLDGDAGLSEVVGSLPARKREWLAHIGLYPLDPQARSAIMLDQLISAPEDFQAALVKTLQQFWDAIFAETWNDLQPALEASVRLLEQQYEACEFPDFLRHTLLPVEFDEKKRVLRALRGGYELPWNDVSLCTFTPSAFNEGRLWTVYSEDTSPSPWFPCFDPDLELSGKESEPVPSGPVPDIALIFRALGDTTRFALVSLVGRKPSTAIELAGILSVSKPTVSHHIHILRSAGLIHETAHGGSVLISLNRSMIENLSELSVKRIFESRDPLDLKRSRR